MPTFVYSPKVEVKVKTTYHGVVDLTEDLVEGSLVLRENRPHTFIFRLQNVKRKYDGVLRPMDPIVVTMRRFGKPMKVFTGYLNNGPVFSVWPRVLELTASCTLKRLQFWYWDPTSLEAVKLLQEWRKQVGLAQDQGQQQQPGAPQPQQPGQPPPAGQAPQPLAPQGGGPLATTSGQGKPAPPTPSGNATQPGAPQGGGPLATITGQGQPQGQGQSPTVGGQQGQQQKQGGIFQIDPSLPPPFQNLQQQPGTNNATGQSVDPNAPQQVDPNKPVDPNAPQQNAKPKKADGGIKELVIALLNAVVGWPAEKIHIGKLPDKWLEYVEEIAKEIQEKTDQTDLIGDLGGNAGGGGGGGAGGASGGQLHPGNYGGVEINAEQAKNASIIYNVGKNKNLPRKAMVIALMAAKVESDLINVNHGDRDSLGLFQMRPSMGWGTAQEVTDPIYASNKFYDELLKVGGWEGMAPGPAAQAVEKSGFPGKYAQWEGMANAIVDAMEKGGGGGTAPAPAAATAPAPAPAPGAPAPPAPAPPPNGGTPPPQFPNNETFPYMVEQIKKKFPDIAVTAQKDDHDRDGGYHNPWGQAIDISLGPGNSRAVEAADWIFATFPNVTQIISAQWRGGKGRLDSNGPGKPPGQLIDHVFSENPGHANHIHWAMKPEAFAGANAVAGGGGGGGGGQGQDAFNAVINVYTWGLQPDLSGVMFFGPRAMINDSPLLPYIGNIMQAGMRNFCSAPNGDFMAWFPDHFGIWGHAGKMKVRAVELMDFTVEWSDQEIVTHQYVVGAPSALINTADFSVQSNTGNYMWNIMTQGIVTMDFPKVFKLLFGEDASEEFVKDYLQRFGGRPKTEQVAYIQAGRPEFFLALVLFMKRWADQFKAEVPMTFMPELWPGMLLVLEEFSFQAYIKEVKHDFKYGPEGFFRTKAKVNAPSRLGKDGAANDIFGLLPLAGPRPLPDGDDTQSGPGTPATTDLNTNDIIPTGQLQSGATGQTDQP